MMKLKAIRQHGNARGDAFWKKEGDVYELAAGEAAGLISAGLVEAEETEPRKAKSNRGKTDAG